MSTVPEKACQVVARGDCSNRAASAFGASLESGKIALKSSNLLIFFVASLAVGLNHAGIIAGVNISFADLLLPILILHLALCGQIRVPLAPLLFVLTVLSVGTAVGAFVTPVRYPIVPDFRLIVIDVWKLLVLFGYLVLGYSLARRKQISLLLRAFGNAAAVVSGVGVIVWLIRVPILHEKLFYQGIRFRGLFDDPNYYAVISVAALCVWLAFPRKNRWMQILGVALLVFGILLSGSKTGTIALLAYSGFLLLRTTFFSDDPNQKRSVIRDFLGISGLLLLVLSARLILGYFIEIAGRDSSLSRVSLMFVNFQEALDASGSGRGSAWDTALQIIDENPVFGVGFGAYGLVAKQVSGNGTIAHNTYLQLGADWGLALSILGLGSVVFFLLRRTVISKSRALFGVKSIIYVMLIGSSSISLNNVRLFWLAFGVLFFYSNAFRRTNKVSGGSHVRTSFGQMKIDFGSPER